MLLSVIITFLVAAQVSLNFRMDFLFLKWWLITNEFWCHLLVIFKDGFDHLFYRIVLDVWVIILLQVINDEFDFCLLFVRIYNLFWIVVYFILLIWIPRAILEVWLPLLVSFMAIKDIWVTVMADLVSGSILFSLLIALALSFTSCVLRVIILIWRIALEILTIIITVWISRKFHRNSMPWQIQFSVWKSTSNKFGSGHSLYRLLVDPLIRFATTHRPQHK